MRCESSARILEPVSFNSYVYISVGPRKNCVAAFSLLFPQLDFFCIHIWHPIDPLLASVPEFVFVVSMLCIPDVVY